MKILARVMLLAMCLMGCTDPGDARRILESQGFKNIQFTGYSFFACSKDDTFHTGFKALSPVGTPVAGTVCAGLFFKNSTIRFE